MQPENAQSPPALRVADRSPDRSPDRFRAVTVTVRVRDRRPHFAQAVFTRHCIDFLRALAALTGTPPFAYCLMPDHVHLLLGPSPVVSAPGFVGRWKALCAREWHRRCGEGSFWQAGFVERVLADDEDLLRVGNYILMNPVRAGLVSTPDAYAFSGSLEWDLSPSAARRAGGRCM